MRRAVLPLLCCAAGVAAVRLEVLGHGPLVALRAEAARAYPDWLKPCILPGVPGPALCGTYDVWENRARKRGRRVGLHVLVLPARGPSRVPDPVFYLAGGPGSGASLSAAFLARVLAAPHASRDLVFIDVRGTGRSQALDCPVLDRDAPAQLYFSWWLSAEYVRSCRARQTADVTQYHTTNAVDDIEEVRAALEYEQVNLLGVSGGTRTAQIYLRRHPRSVRSAVLKGVVPMDFEMPLPFSRALENGMRGLIDACAADPGCRTVYPELQADWSRVQRRFEAGAVSAYVTHPYSRRQERVRIERGVFADALRHFLYSTQQSRRLPTLLRSAARGDFTPFAQLQLTQVIELQQQIAEGVFLSATCTEDLPFISEQDIESATAGTFLGDYRARLQAAACAIWLPGTVANAVLQQPVRSVVPVLLISGEFDTATPPDAAERVARHLSNGRHIVFPNQAHDFANPACEAGIIAVFLDSLQPNALDTRCVADTHRPPFLVPSVR